MTCGRKRRQVVLAVMVAMSGADAATFNDPDWPCIQRKVSRLSIGQVWTGPPLDLTAPARTTRPFRQRLPIWRRGARAWRKPPR